MLNTLEQAHVAAQQGNWSLLNQHLQQLPLSKNGKDSPFLREGDCQQALQLALQVIEAGDFQEKWDAAKVFPKLGKCSIAPLIAILENEEADLDVRWFASRILGEFDDPVVVISLVQLLQSAEDEELAQMAAQALSNIGSSAIAALSNLLAQEESRYLAVQALAQIRRPETITPLLSVVHDPLPSIRSTAIEALTSFRDRPLGGAESNRSPMMTAYLQNVVGKLLGFPEEQLPDSQLGFFDMGMDSLLSLELRNLLQTSLGCSVSATVLFEYTNIEALAEYLITEIFASELEATVETSDKDKQEKTLASQEEVTDAIAQKFQQIQNLLDKN